MNKLICAIYDRRPRVCREFPSNAAMIKEFPSCSYWFNEEGKRHGECNGCGECCVNMQFNHKKYSICPYLNKEK
jgi:Fe-S-cluster containining protein